MNAVKNEFLKAIKSVNTYDEFEMMLEKLTSKTKGDYFELFFKLYFLIFQTHQSVYLYPEIPEIIKAKLNLPIKDMGIDGIIITLDGKYLAVQVKYRKDKQTIPFGELATFPALAFGTDCKYISGGIFFTNCYDVCDKIKGDKYQNITYNCFDKCSGDFWNNCRDYLTSEKILGFIPYTSLPHQEKILPIAKKHYEENNYGKLYLPCGTGKSLMGVFISSINILKSTKVFIVVPSLYLLSDTYETWSRQLYNDKRFKFLLIGSDLDEKDNIQQCEYKLTTNEDEIKLFFDSNDDCIVVITTYQSSQLLKNVCEKIKFSFNIGIYDEAHRTVGNEDMKFTSLLSNKKLSTKRLFMTATEKVYRYDTSKLNSKQLKNILSMDKEDVYGKVIYNYSTRQAIVDKQLVDYNVIAMFISADKYDDMIKNHNYVKINSTDYEIELLAIGVMVVKSFKDNNVSHLLIFSNSNEKAQRLIEIIDQILKHEKLEIHTKYINGSDSMNKRKQWVKIFEESKKGIISSSRIFGEGVNIPICDAVCFADHKSSTIDIVQYVGRGLRLCKSKPDKLSNIIVPFILDTKNETEFFDNECVSFKKIRKILKALGTTDDMVSEKFSLKNSSENISVAKNDKDNDSQMIMGQKLDLIEFKQHIIAKVFDKTGNPMNRIRKKIINENKRRLVNNQELIDTKIKCFQYLKDEHETETPSPKNWIRFCLGDDLFLELTKKYCYSIDDLINSCFELQITCFEEYIYKYSKNHRLPSPSYIDGGFYQDLDEKFNLDSLLQKHKFIDF